MEEFAEWFFDLHSELSGTTKWEHLKQVERQTGQKPRGLTGPPFPDLLAHVWSAFFSLSRSRKLTLQGAEPITYEAIHYWQELTGSVLSPRDVEALMRLDQIYRRKANG